MILNEKHGTVKEYGVLSKNTFDIEVSSKMFEMLYNNLYSNKIESIVRELSSNAYDSHVAAGKEDKPFSVICPTYKNNSFIIRDYGTGLTEQEVQDIYTKLFKSTKSESNDFVGCIGLGSKSPFCYTKQFSVESYVKGKSYIYSMFIDTNGIPTYAKLYEGDTQEPDGIKITIPVNSQDSNNFVKACRNIYCNYKTLPNINISIDKKGYEEELDFEYGKIKITKYSGYRYSYSDTPGVLIMGNNYFIPDGKHKLPAGIDVEIPIGFINVTISREGIQYDKHTETNLSNLRKALDEKISEYIDSKLQGCCTFSKCQKLDKLNYYVRNCINSVPHIDTNNILSIPQILKHRFNYRQIIDNDELYICVRKKNKSKTSYLDKNWYSNNKDKNVIEYEHGFDIKKHLKDNGICDKHIKEVDVSAIAPRNRYYNIYSWDVFSNSYDNYKKEKFYPKTDVDKWKGKTMYYVDFRENFTESGITIPWDCWSMYSMYRDSKVFTKVDIVYLLTPSLKKFLENEKITLKNYFSFVHEKIKNVNLTNTNYAKVELQKYSAIKQFSSKKKEIKNKEFIQIINEFENEEKKIDTLKTQSLDKNLEEFINNYGKRFHTSITVIETTIGKKLASFYKKNPILQPFFDDNVGYWYNPSRNTDIMEDLIRYINDRK